MYKLLTSFLTTTLLLLLSLSCNEGPIKAKKGAACLSDESFNSKARTCVKTRFLPMPTLRYTSVVEVETDTALSINLAYSDTNNDFAESCTATNFESPSYFTSSTATCVCVGGVCSAKPVFKANLPTGHSNVISSFRYTITDKDGTSDEQLVQLTLVPVNGAPTLQSGSSQSYSINQNLNYSSDVTTGSFYSNAVEALSRVKTLNSTVFQDEDGDALTIRLVEAPSANLGYLCDFDSNDGTHICNINGNASWNKIFFQPIKGQTGTTSFKFKACDPYNACSSNYTVNLTIDEIDDMSLVSQTVSSSDHLAFDFELDNTASDTSANFVVTTLPTLGVLSGTVANFTAPNLIKVENATLNFDPVSSTANKTGSAASKTIGNLTYTSKFNSALANNIQIAYTSSSSLKSYSNSGTSVYKYFSNVVVTNTGTNASPGWLITVNMVTGGTTEAEVKELIENDWYASKLVSVSGTASGTVSSQSATSLTGGVNGYDFFVYCLNNAGACDTTYPRAVVSVDIVKGNQAPKICEYSSFLEAPECGFDGCIGTTTPVSRITPRSSGVFYYDTTTHTCYESNGTTSTSWAINALSEISNQKVNEYSVIKIKTRIDEDETGAPSQDTEEIRLKSITSSDVTIFPKANISFTYGATTFTPAILPSAWFGSTTLSSDSEDLTINLSPIAGKSGSSTITMVFQDTTLHETTISFVAEVVAANAIFTAWKNIKSVGAKTVRTGVELDCPYSLTKCNGGSACTGTPSPDDLALGFTPDSVGAVYYESDSNKCYYASNTTLSGWIEYKPYLNQVFDRSLICPYSRTKCSGFECKGTSSPLNAVTPDMKGAIYFDSTNNKCYYAMDSASSSAWTEFTTYCGITESDYKTSTEVVSSCGATYGASCIGNGEPTTTPNKLDELYYDVENSICYRSFDTASGNDWEAFVAPANITIEAKAFDLPLSITRSEVRYNIYRRKAGESFDYDFPINKVEVKEDLDFSSIVFNDDGVSSYLPPSPNTVYYYEMVPVINGILARTNDDNQNPRVLAAPDNQALVHRWVVNMVNCQKLGLSSDPNDDYSCDYVGPGDNDGKTKQDYDLLVDRFEVGCAYTRDCSNSVDGSCIGVANPNTSGTVTASKNAIFYDRQNGRCYKRHATIANSWSEISGSNLPSKTGEYNYGYLPPLVWQSQSDAQLLCQNQASYGILGINDVDEPIARDLPNRKEQVGYSLWQFDETGNDEPSITEHETGFSFDFAGNTASGCNSSSANGLTSHFNNSDIPASSDFFTLPNTLSSGVKSFVTGSEQTKFCQSRFGVQDTIGNVSEWATDRVRCNEFMSCSALNSLNDNELSPAITLLDSLNSLLVDLGAELSYREFNLFPWGGLPTLNGAHTMASSGLCPLEADKPANESRYFGVCPSVVDSWTIKDNLYNLDKFFAPTGLLLHKDYLTLNPASTITAASVSTTTNTRNDIFSPNRPIIFSEIDGCGGMVTGGSYLNGTGAGIYYLEFVPCTENPAMSGKAGYLQHSDFVIKAKVSGITDISFELYSDPTDAAKIVVDNVTKDVSVNISSLADENSDGVIDYRDVAEIVNTTPAAFNLMEVFPLVGNSRLYPTTSLVNFKEVTLKKKRRDIGFRCLTRIEDSYYEE